MFRKYSIFYYCQNVFPGHSLETPSLALRQKIAFQVQQRAVARLCGITNKNFFKFMLLPCF